MCLHIICWSDLRKIHVSDVSIALCRVDSTLLEHQWDNCIASAQWQ